jgi:hypothetical protein
LGIAAKRRALASSAKRKRRGGGEACLVRGRARKKKKLTYLALAVAHLVELLGEVLDGLHRHCSGQEENKKNKRGCITKTRNMSCAQHKARGGGGTL